MNFGKSIVSVSVNRPRLVTTVMLGVMLVIALLAGLPSIWPDTFSSLHPLRIDTDPENMLPEDEGVRVFHNDMRKRMSLHDMIAVGVVNDSHPEGVFNPQSLKNIYELTQHAKTIRWPDKKNPEKHHGVVEVDIIAPSTVDNIEQAGLGVVRFEWLMQKPPTTDEDAIAIREKAKRIPFLDDTLVSHDGKALAIYLPITSKDVSYKVSELLQEKVDTFSGNDEFHITGLPVAQDTFGVEMFIQMAISAPVAMLIIFLLLLFFFKKFAIIISPLIVAFVCTVYTMGLLVISGNTVHIMSSMIPIFIMPIAVLDAIHILSEFFDRYQETRDRKATMTHVMDTLFMPMLYTSLTTTAGFASLALTPIPPVQVFGIFVALGVMLAWFWTITFVPAAVMFIPERSLQNYGLAEESEEDASWSSRLLSGVGSWTFRRARVLLVITLLVFGASVYGMSKIRINDNPTKWFKASHPIRVADRVLNSHFGGTYMAYLALSAGEDSQALDAYRTELKEKLNKFVGDKKKETPGLEQAAAVLLETLPATTAENKMELLAKLEDFGSEQSMNASFEDAAGWDDLLLFLSREGQAGEVFKKPEVLSYIEKLQEHFLTTGVVGKSNSLADIVKTVHRELFLGEDEAFRIPDSSEAVAQTLITYQNSHRPQDLWHFVTPDYKTSSLWLQLRSGDNLDMSKVIQAVDEFAAANPPPENISLQWFGQTYINVVWQGKMVSGMLTAFLGSFFVVLLMMILLFRSALWGILSMVPLTVTIVFIYGAIGFIGKDYDMPVAVLSSLSLGLAIDYAIHFLARSREITAREGTWAGGVKKVFGEPARAIARNVVVVGVGFLPLLFAPLVPYQTVGVFIAAILVTAGVASLLILPSMITMLERWLFPETEGVKLTCKCGTCVVTAIAAVGFLALNIREFLALGWTTMSWVSAATLLVALGVCCLMSRREACRLKNEDRR